VQWLQKERGSIAGCSVAVGQVADRICLFGKEAVVVTSKMDNSNLR